MSAPPFMPLYVADYLGDTTHLSTEEHGAYLLILMAMWRAGGQLPCEAARLAKFARLTPARWARMEVEIMALFDVQDDHIGHKRLEREFNKYAKISEERAKSGAAGGKAKSLKNKEPPLANGVAKRSQLEPESEPEIEDSPISPNGEIAPQGARPKRVKKKTICPADWKPTDSHFAKARELGTELADFENAEARFREWEFKDGKTNFDLAFHRWLREDAKRRGQGNGSTTSRPRWSLDRERKTSAYQQGVVDFVNGGGGRE